MLRSIYNYIMGYVYIKCSNCNREIYMKSNDIIEGVDISCSHGCTFELYRKHEQNKLNK
jgi:hypothetical protein